MEDQDQEWAAFFAEERRRDLADAPGFDELLPPAPAEPATASRGAVWRRALGGLAAAGMLGALVVIGLDRRDGGSAGSTSGDIDTACDAALVALQEQESESLMELPTDTLFRE